MTEEELKTRALAYIQNSVDLYYEALDCGENDTARRVFKRYVAITDMFENIFGEEVNIRDGKVYVEGTTV